MERLVEKVTALLEDTFTGIEIGLMVKKGVGKVGGFVIWSGFTGKAQLERQSLIWNVLRGGLSFEQQMKVGTILTLSPEELAANREIVPAK